MTLKVVELFAGVGGFRLGLEKSKGYKVVWSNQWEPSTKTQHASKVYEARFGPKGHTNQNIETVSTEDIPDHDMLVGGFPCQDYSVATTLQNAKGLIGKKGVLWWSIHRILREKAQKPSILLFENVDRLLLSPSQQRGRDFAIILQSLSELGYVVEWRVINAAEYGMPQRRRRLFFLGYHKDSPLYQKMVSETPLQWLNHKGTLAQAFPAMATAAIPQTFKLQGSLPTLSKNFNKEQGLSPFMNSGVCIDGQVHTLKMKPLPLKKAVVLEDILEKGAVAPEFFIPKEDIPKWTYLKGAKKEMRTSRSGHSYFYNEGSMVFPDALDAPSRTIVTGEGGKSPSRFKHVVQTPKGLRRLTPIELERLNMFPDNHTQLQGISNTKRAFFMGNALVVGIVEKIGKTLLQQLQQAD